jgi:hypothetical protein
LRSFSWATAPAAVKAAKNIIKHKADVRKFYGELPEIQGSPSQINQVFLNIITNAAQAIQEKGEIAISTAMHDDRPPGPDQNVTPFEVAPDGATWTTVGDEVIVSGAAIVCPATDPLVVGGADGAMFNGHIRQMSLEIGGQLITHPQFYLEDPSTSVFTDSEGIIWNVDAFAEIVSDPDAPLISPDEPECQWVRVANVHQEQLTEWVDRTAPRCKDIRYRIRTVGAGGAISPFAESNVITPRPTQAELVLTSNHRPDLEVVHDHTPDVPYEFLDHEADELVPIYGSDNFVAFYESEDRGVEVQFEIYANFLDVPRNRFGSVIGGKAVFEPLRLLSRAEDIPYIVVLDHEGNVYQAHVQLRAGRNEEPLHRYTLTIVVTPVSGDVIPVEVGV